MDGIGLDWYIYEQLHQQLMAVLHTPDELVITTDIRSSSASVSYATYTGHFVDMCATL